MTVALCTLALPNIFHLYSVNYQILATNTKLACFIRTITIFYAIQLSCIVININHVWLWNSLMKVNNVPTYYLSMYNVIKPFSSTKDSFSSMWTSHVINWTMKSVVVLSFTDLFTKFALTKSYIHIHTEQCLHCISGVRLPSGQYSACIGRICTVYYIYIRKCWFDCFMSLKQLQLPVLLFYCSMQLSWFRFDWHWNP